MSGMFAKYGWWLRHCRYPFLSSHSPCTSCTYHSTVLSPYLETFKEPGNRFQEIDSANLCSLAIYKYGLGNFRIMYGAQAGGTVRQLGSYSLPSLQIVLKFQRRYFLTVKEPKNRFQRIVSASLAGRYDNPIPIRFLAPRECSQIPARHCFTSPFLSCLFCLIFSLEKERKD